MLDSVLSSDAPRRVSAALIACVGALLFAAPAWSQPTLSMAYAPAEVAVDANSRLTFTLMNPDAAPATDTAFSLVLPSGVEISPVPGAESDCLANVTAAAGSGAVSVAVDRFGAGETCTIGVNVSARTAGTFTSTTSMVTSSAGGSDGATADLFASESLPRITAELDPASVRFGGRSTYVFTVTAQGMSATALTLTSTLPDGMQIASPARVSTTCAAGSVPANVTADSGADRATVIVNGLDFNGFRVLEAGESCELRFDVVVSGSGGTVRTDAQATTAGSFAVPLGYTATELTVVPPASLFATADVLDDPTPAGGLARVAISIANTDRSSTVTDIGLSLDLDAALAGLAAEGLPLSDVCGAGSSVAGTDLVTLTGGLLEPGGRCDFTVSVRVPPAASDGVATLTTSALTGSASGRAVDGDGASAPLFHTVLGPVATVAFVPDVVAAGDESVLRFSIHNPAAVPMSAGTMQLFTDALGDVEFTLPPAGFCGAGSNAADIRPPDFARLLDLSGLTVAAGETCMFDVPVAFAAGSSPGLRVAPAGDLVGTLGGGAFASSVAPVSVTLVAGPALAIAFPDGPVLAGDTTTLSLTLALLGELPEPASGIAFTLDLDAALSGLVATGLPVFDACGTGSMLTGTSLLSFSGGSLDTDEPCEMLVDVLVPAGVRPGAYPLVSSNVSATVAGVTAAGASASGSLSVQGLEPSLTVLPATLLPGSDAAVELVIENRSATFEADSVTAQLAFADALPGWTYDTSTAVVNCGAGATLVDAGAGQRAMLFGGAIPPGGTCSVTVSTTIPAAAAIGRYSLRAGVISAAMDGAPLSVPGPRADFSVADGLAVDAAFSGAIPTPGGLATLEITASVADLGDSATGLELSVDLDGALAGLVAEGLPLADVCGAGSQLAGEGVVTLTNGTLPPSGACTFPLTLRVPEGVAPGTPVTVETGMLTGSVGGAATTSGRGATATTSLHFVRGEMAFDAPTEQGDTATLAVTLTPWDATTPVENIRFALAVPAPFTGAELGDAVPEDACGFTVSGGGASVSFSGGVLDGAPCTFTVPVFVPESVDEDVYPFGTSPITSGPAEVGVAMSADLTVLERVVLPDPGPDAGDVGPDASDAGFDAGDVGPDAGDVGSDVGGDVRSDAGGADVGDTGDAGDVEPTDVGVDSTAEDAREADATDRDAGAMSDVDSDGSGDGEVTGGGGGGGCATTGSSAVTGWPVALLLLLVAGGGRGRRKKALAPGANIR